MTSRHLPALTGFGAGLVLIGSCAIAPFTAGEVASAAPPAVCEAATAEATPTEPAVDEAVMISADCFEAGASIEFQVIPLDEQGGQQTFTLRADDKGSTPEQEYTPTAEGAYNIAARGVSFSGQEEQASAQFTAAEEPGPDPDGPPEEPTDKPTEEPTDKPDPTPTPTEEPSPEPTEPTEEPTDGESDPGLGTPSQTDDPGGSEGSGDGAPAAPDGTDGSEGSGSSDPREDDSDVEETDPGPTASGPEEPAAPEETPAQEAPTQEAPSAEDPSSEDPELAAQNAVEAANRLGEILRAGGAGGGSTDSPEPSEDPASAEGVSAEGLARTGGLPGLPIAVVALTVGVGAVALGVIISRRRGRR